jgi:hypothetical protein
MEAHREGARHVLAAVATALFVMMLMLLLAVLHRLGWLTQAEPVDTIQGDGSELDDREDWSVASWSPRAVR